MLGSRALGSLQLAGSPLTGSLPSDVWVSSDATFDVLACDAVFAPLAGDAAFDAVTTDAVLDTNVGDAALSL